MMLATLTLSGRREQLHLGNVEEESGVHTTLHVCHYCVLLLCVSVTPAIMAITIPSNPECQFRGGLVLHLGPD